MHLRMDILTFCTPTYLTWSSETVVKLVELENSWYCSTKRRQSNVGLSPGSVGMGGADPVECSELCPVDCTVGCPFDCTVGCPFDCTAGCTVCCTVVVDM